ncbi:MAG: hypothetical protein KGL39_20505 [Patescibacteria group bacterium]|nr:hypothetical protein [Patescibacteria group bacterium]
MATWHERIDAAEKRGGFTVKDRIDAGGWVTCACGEQDRGIPYCSDGTPADRIIYRQGMLFTAAVEAGDFDAVRQALAAIERRAAELLAEHTGENR